MVAENGKRRAAKTKILKPEVARAVAATIAGVPQREQAEQEGVTRQAISKRLQQGIKLVGQDLLDQSKRDLADLSPLAVTGVKNHLSEHLPNPKVISDFLYGMRIYSDKQEISGSLTFEQITARRKAAIAAGLARFKKRKGQ